MKATETRQHKDQTEITVVTVTLPGGKVQAFNRMPNGRVYVGTNYWTAEQFAVGLEKMRAAGATVVESIGYVFE